MADTATFQGIIDRLTTTVQRDDLVSKYLDITNQAIRDIAVKHSFPEMKSTGNGLVLIGTTQAILPADFKELQGGRYPIFDTPQGGTGSLVPVFTREEVEKLLPVGLVPPGSFIYTQDSTAGTMQYRIDLPSPAAVQHNFTVYYMAYPDRCDDPTVLITTPLIVNYFNLVLEKALSLAFQSINDPIYLLHEKEFLTEYGIITGEDVTRALRALQPVKG